MPIVTLTMEKIQELTNQTYLKIHQRDELKKKTPTQLWIDDLDALDEMLNERLRQRQKAEREERGKVEKARAKAGFKDARRADHGGKGKQREAKRYVSAPALGCPKKSKTG